MQQGGKAAHSHSLLRKQAGKATSGLWSLPWEVHARPKAGLSSLSSTFIQ